VYVCVCVCLIDSADSSQVSFDRRWAIPASEIQTQALLGSGSFGAVYEALWQGRTKVAAKQIHFLMNQSVQLPEEIRSVALSNFYNECRINSQLRHPNIVQFLGVAVDAVSSVPQMLILEFMEHGSLSRALYAPNTRRLSHAQQLSVLMDVCSALLYLHSRSPPILHLDVKPDNILIDQSGRAKLADLGESVVVQSTRCANRLLGVGTPNYMAPEMRDGGIKRDRTDMFSFGIVVTEVLLNRRPNPGPEMVQTGDRLYQLVLEEQRRASDIMAIAHHELRNLVQHLVVHQLQDRWSAAQTLTALLAISNTAAV
jgi:serine/threonine protein kinase